MNTKGPSIQRINFIQQDRFVLTHRRMVVSAGALAGVCLLLLGLQWARIAYADRRLAGLELEVRQLREERDRISKQISSLQGEMSARDFLSNLFERTPAWASVLKELRAVMPRSLWLTRVKASDRSDVTTPLGLQLNGRSEEAASIARFLKALNASAFFNDVVLNSSQQIDPANGVGYFFTVDLVVVPAQGKGF